MESWRATVGIKVTGGMLIGTFYSCFKNKMISLKWVARVGWKMGIMYNENSNPVFIGTASHNSMRVDDNSALNLQKRFSKGWETKVSSK